MRMVLKSVAAATIAVGMLMGTSAYAGIEAKCKACHDFGTKHKMGPALKGIMGIKAGSTSFKGYKPAMKKGGWVWDEANMRLWLGDSKAAIKTLSGDAGAKTSMPPQKLKGAKLDQMIEFLKGLK